MTDCFIDVNGKVKVFFILQIIFSIILAIGFTLKLKYFTPNKQEAIQLMLEEKARQALLRTSDLSNNKATIKAFGT